MSFTKFDLPNLKSVVIHYTKSSSTMSEEELMRWDPFNPFSGFKPMEGESLEDTKARFLYLTKGLITYDVLCPTISIPYDDYNVRLMEWERQRELKKQLKIGGIRNNFYGFSRNGIPARKEAPKFEAEKRSKRCCC